VNESDEEQTPNDEWACAKISIFVFSFVALIGSKCMVLKDTFRAAKMVLRGKATIDFSCNTVKKNLCGS
jgi:hypothetical protein